MLLEVHLTHAGCTSITYRGGRSIGLNYCQLVDCSAAGSCSLGALPTPRSRSNTFWSQRPGMAQVPADVWTAVLRQSRDVPAEPGAINALKLAQDLGAPAAGARTSCNRGRRQ